MTVAIKWHLGLLLIGALQVNLSGRNVKLGGCELDELPKSHVRINVELDVFGKLGILSNLVLKNDLFQEVTSIKG